MIISTRFVHTNLVARNWQRLARFYEQVFDCTPVPPERDLSGQWLEEATGIPGAHIRGIHLRLPGYGDELLENLSSSGKLPLVAEDLGIITTEVRELRDRYALPGMAVMQFGFDGSSDNPHLPQNVAYFLIMASLNAFGVWSALS